MKKIFIISTLLITSFTYVNATQHCKELPGFKKIGKGSLEYIKCQSNQKTDIKFNTDSTFTDVVTGKKKIKIPNPLTGLKNIGKALKPDNPLERK